VVRSFSEGLIRAGQLVEIVTLDKPGSAWLSPAGFPIHALGPGLTSYGYSKHLLPWLRHHTCDQDRVIVHGLWQYSGFAAWRHFAQTSTPYYVFPHGMLDPWFKRTFPIKHLKKWFYWLVAQHRILRDARAVIFTSEEEHRAGQGSFWPYCCRERVSALGVEDPQSDDAISKNTLVARYPILRNTRVLLFLGRLHPKKGCDLLIDALAKAASTDRNLSLVLAGPDQVGWEKDLRKRVHRLASAVPVVFPGMLEGDVKREAFQISDALILPSHQENFGMSVVEALSFGVPVLISNRVNIWREIEADRAGYVEPDSLAGVTRLIERWLGTPESARKSMRENARRCFESRFEIRHATSSLMTILNEATTGA